MELYHKWVNGYVTFSKGYILNHVYYVPVIFHARPVGVVFKVIDRSEYRVSTGVGHSQSLVLAFELHVEIL